MWEGSRSVGRGCHSGRGEAVNLSKNVVIRPCAGGGIAVNSVSNGLCTVIKSIKGEEEEVEMRNRKYNNCLALALAVFCLNGYSFKADAQIVVPVKQVAQPINTWEWGFTSPEGTNYKVFKRNVDQNGALTAWVEIQGLVPHSPVTSSTGSGEQVISWMYISVTSETYQIYVQATDGTNDSLPSEPSDLLDVALSALGAPSKPASVTISTETTTVTITVGDSTVR